MMMLFRKAGSIVSSAAENKLESFVVGSSMNYHGAVTYMQVKDAA